MPLKFYKSSKNSGMRQQPNDYYRDLQQAFIDGQWENTSTIYTVEEQDGFGLATYHEVEVWMNKVIGQTTTFAKNGEDYRQLLFRDINKENVRGLYYRFENDYWVTDFTNVSQGLAKSITVRRCNNVLRIVDPQNGSIFSIPCVVDYDMTSPTMLINSNILTPNNHAIIYVQANEDTRRLFTLNKRFILNGRVFKLLAYQNALNRGLDEQVPTILYLDLYLDEIHANDNLETQVAYNGEYIYELSVESNTLKLTKGTIGTIDTIVTLNNEEVNRELVFESANPEIVTFYQNGKFEVFGNVGDTVELIVYLKGNENVKQVITVNVVESVTPTAVLSFDPEIAVIRQYQTMTTKVNINYGEQDIVPTNVTASLSGVFNILSNDYLTLSVENNEITIQCKKFGSTQTIFVKAISIDPVIEAEAEFNVECNSLMG